MATLKKSYGADKQVQETSCAIKGGIGNNARTILVECSVPAY